METPNIYDERDFGCFFIDNRIIDFYLPLIGSKACVIYFVMARSLHGKHEIMFDNLMQLLKPTRFSESTIQNALRGLLKYNIIKITATQNNMLITLNNLGV